MDEKKMHIVVTGGAGFIGSNLCSYLSDKGISVTVIDNLSSGCYGNIEGIKGLTFIHAKVEDVEFSKLGKIDAIVHLAAQVSVQKSINTFEASAKTNLLSALRVIDFCRLHNVPYVYASSSAVYGGMGFGDDEGEAVDLLSPYAVDKRAMELYAKNAFYLHKTPSIGLRFFNIYGPKQDSQNPYSGVISIFMSRIFNRNSLRINGGDQTRDFVYVQDAVKAIYNATNLLQSKKVCETVNVLTGFSVSINKLADIIFEQVGEEVQKEFNALSPGEVIHSSGTTEKMARVLNLLPSQMISLSEGIRSTALFYKNECYVH